MAHPYLLLIGVLLPFLNLVNNLGGYYASVAAIMNTVGLAIQLFIRSRMVKYLGLRWGLLLLPIYSLGAYGLIAM